MFIRRHSLSKTHSRKKILIRKARSYVTGTHFMYAQLKPLSFNVTLHFSGVRKDTRINRPIRPLRFLPGCAVCRRRGREALPRDRP